MKRKSRATIFRREGLAAIRTLSATLDAVNCRLDTLNARLDSIGDLSALSGHEQLRETQETRFALLDATHGDPEGHAHNVWYVANELPKDFAAGGRLQRLAADIGASPETLARALRGASPERLQTVAAVAVDADGIRTLLRNDGSRERSAEIVAQLETTLRVEADRDAAPAVEENFVGQAIAAGMAAEAARIDAERRAR